MPTDNAAVSNLAQAVLDTVVAQFDAAGVALPKRREIVIGSLSVDDEVLGVMFGGLHVGPPGNEVSVSKDHQPRTAIFNIELWRKSPVGDSRGRAPRATALTDRAKAAMADAWILLQAAYAADELQTGVMASVAPLEPQGGMQGNSMELRLAVP